MRLSMSCRTIPTRRGPPSRRIRIFPVFLIGHSMAGSHRVLLYGAKYPYKSCRYHHSGALTYDNGGLITRRAQGVISPHHAAQRAGRRGQLCGGGGDWYGKDPYNTKTLNPTGLCNAICDGLHGLRRRSTASRPDPDAPRGEVRAGERADTSDFFRQCCVQGQTMKDLRGLFHESSMVLQG
jgi:lysophospholipase